MPVHSIASVVQFGMGAGRGLLVGVGAKVLLGVIGGRVRGCWWAGPWVWKPLR